MEKIMRPEYLSMSNNFFRKCAWCICVMVFLLPGLLAQQKTITGVIKDRKGSVVRGVSVVVKGTTEGTFSSVDGKYTIRVPNDKSILVFSMKGFATQEIIAGDQREINVTIHSKKKYFDPIYDLPDEFVPKEKKKR